MAEPLNIPFPDVQHSCASRHLRSVWLVISVPSFFVPLRVLSGQSLFWRLVMLDVGFCSSPRFVEHVTGPHHPERPDRIRAIHRAVREAGLIDSPDPFPDFPARPGRPSACRHGREADRTGAGRRRSTSSGCGSSTTRTTSTGCAGSARRRRAGPGRHAGRPGQLRRRPAVRPGRWCTAATR